MSIYGGMEKCSGKAGLEPQTPLKQSEALEHYRLFIHNHNYIAPYEEEPEERKNSWATTRARCET